MREQIIKMTELLETVLNKQGESLKRNTIYQTLMDFKNSTENEIRRDLINDDHSDIEKLSKNVGIYKMLIDLLETNSIDKNKLRVAQQEIYKVYDFYELKYLLELEYRNQVQRQNYIETILTPLMLINRYFEYLIKSV